jgi:uncharacterized RDD family membrane protein YckC
MAGPTGERTPEPGGAWHAPGPGGFQPAPIEPGPAPGIAYADLVTRVIAFVIDAILLGFASAIVWSLLITTLFISGGLGGVFTGLIVGSVLQLGISAVYFVWSWTTWRASPGQRVLSLQTVNAADGATLTQGQAISRWLYLYGLVALASVASWGGGLGPLQPLLGLAGLAYALYLLYSASQDPKRQGFHDKQAATVVVKRTA